MVEAAAGPVPGWFAGRIGHLTAGELKDWLDSAEAKSFATLAGRQPEYQDLAKVARTTSLSTLEPLSKGSNSTEDEGPPDASEGHFDEAGVADTRSFEAFFEWSDTRTYVRRGCLPKLWEEGRSSEVRPFPKLDPLGGEVALGEPISFQILERYHVAGPR